MGSDREDHLTTELERIFSILDMARHQRVYAIGDAGPQSLDEKIDALYVYLDALIETARKKGKAKGPDLAALQPRAAAAPPPGLDKAIRMLDSVIRHGYAVNSLGTAIEDKTRSVCETLIKVTNTLRKAERLMGALHPVHGDAVLACLYSREAAIGNGERRKLQDIEQRMRDKEETARRDIKGGGGDDPAARDAWTNRLFADALERLVKSAG